MIYKSLVFVFVHVPSHKKMNQGPGTGKIQMPRQAKKDNRTVVVDNAAPLGFANRRRLPEHYYMIGDPKQLEDLDVCGGLKNLKEAMDSPKKEKIPDSLKNKEDEIDDYLTFFVNHQ